MVAKILMPMPDSTSPAPTTWSSSKSARKAKAKPSPNPSKTAMNKVRKGRGWTCTGGEARSTSLTVAVFSSADSRASWMRNNTPR